MAKKVRNEVAVGATVLVVLLLTIYIVVMLADWSSLLTAQQRITVRVPYTVGLKGLSVGSPVHLGGIKIGQITHTRISKLESAEGGGGDIHVFFTMKIPKEYQLRRDCALVPQSNVLGGEALLSIENLGSEGEIIADGETVDLELADSVMDALKREFDSDNPDSILALVKYEVNRDNADSIMASLKRTVAALEEDISEIGRQMQQTLEKAGVALETARSTLNELKELSGDERIDMVIDNITEVSVNLKLTSEEVRRAPWKLLYKPSQKEFKIQSLVDSAGAFAVGAERLDNTAFRLQQLMGTAEEKSVLEEEQIKSMVAELESSFEQFQKAEKKFWEALE